MYSLLTILKNGKFVLEFVFFFCVCCFFIVGKEMNLRLIELSFKCVTHK